MNQKKSRLALKFTIAFIILGLLICITSSTIGYHQYKNSMQEQYNTMAYYIADQAIGYLNMDDVGKYVSLVKQVIANEDVATEIQAITKGQEYQRVQNLIKDLRISMHANDIFLCYIDQKSMNKFNGEIENWNPVYYLYDSFSVPEYSYQLGDCGPFNPTFIDELNKILQTGTVSDSYFISKSKYGYNTYALQPIQLNDDILLMSVEIPMTTIESALNQYIASTVTVTSIIILIVISIYMVYMFKKIIRPINIIAREADAFVENDINQSVTLANIKTNDEIENLATSIIKMQHDINNYVTNLTKITAERERIGAELDVAKNIQSSMLPCIFPAFPERSEFDIFASMCPAKEVGGDFYDFFLTDNDHLVMVIADVSGKGVPAALFMMISKTLLKSAAQTNLTPKQILEKVNNQLCENNNAEMFVTVWLGILELSTGKMVCANAGHEYPALYKKKSGFELYQDKHGFVLAGMEDICYREYTIQLEPNDIVFVYTDGVAEATNLDNELYGTSRMLDALNTCPNLTPTTIASYIKNDVDKFVGKAEQFDDITMLCIRYLGPNNVI